MKNNFYEGVSKKRSRRRRFTSLVLVLSLFVTSGVSWSLHGVGITMANESECGQEEHKHTDECYEKQLVCGPEEDENHIHSDECYETKLVCGKTEHVHDEACYIDAESLEKLQEPEGDTEDATLPIVEINPTSEKDEETLGSEPIAPEDEEFAFEEEGVMDSPILLRGNTADILAGTPLVKDTSDNRADGIRINLFDYGTAAALDSVDENGNANNHLNSPVFDGVNYNYETGEERNVNDDILFFSYGTPNTEFTSGWKQDDNGNWYRDKEALRPDKNNYSGNYDMGEGHDAFSGNRPVQGIVNRNLADDGYPTVNAEGNHSLKYLFDLNGIESDDPNDPVKTVYEDVNKLLTKDDFGKYHYNSNENYAYYNTDPEQNPDKEFTVYDGTFRIINKDHHQNGDPIANNDPEATPQTYQGGTGYDLSIGFFPFNQYDSTNVDPNFNTLNDPYNHHFGMTLEADFALSHTDNYKYKEKNVVFDYSGDDDLWVFLDGMLVLDVGGIHEPAAGRVDFTDGYVWVQDNQLPDMDAENFDLASYLKDTSNGTADSPTPYKGFAFPDGYDGNGPCYDDYDGYHIPWEFERIDYKFPTNGQENTIKTKKYKISELLIAAKKQQDSSFNPADEIAAYIAAKKQQDPSYEPDHELDYWDVVKEGDHNIKIFYLERGGNYSNLAMEFNLPVVKPIQVVKDVKSESGLYDDRDFDMQLFIKNANYDPDPDSENYDPREFIPYRGTMKRGDTEEFIENGEFKIKNGEKVIFPRLSGELEYYVVEKNLDPEIVENVVIKDNNGDPVGIVNTPNFDDNGGFTEVQSATQQSINQNGTLVFENEIKEKWADVTVQKDWEEAENSNPDHSNDKIKFKLYRTDSQTGETVVLSENRKQTFVLTDPTWKKVLSQQPIRYGDHYYTYDVKELAVPAGYSDTYSIVTDSEGNVTLHIINTDKNKVEINVKKEWENTDGLTLPDTINAKLTRQFVGFKNPSPGNLTVRVVDLEGNVKGFWTEPNVYQDGRAEFSLEPPYGTVVKDWIGQGCDVTHKDGSEFYEVENISADSMVIIKVDDSNAGGGLIFRSSFTDDTEGWGPRGGETVAVTSELSYATGKSLKISGRNKSWNGPSIELDHRQFKPGLTYSFESKVRCNEQDTTFNMKLQYITTDSSKDPTQYFPIGEVTAASNSWGTIQATKALPSDIDITQPMYLYIENNNTSDFYVDEVAVAPGTTTISVERTSGNVSFSNPPSASPYKHDSFNSGNGGWTSTTGSSRQDGYSAYKSGNAFQVIRTNANDAGNSYSGTVKQYDGARLNLPNNLQQGETYSFSVDVFYDKYHTWGENQVVTHNANAPNNVQFQMTLVYDDANGRHYDWIASNTVNIGEWTQISNTTFKIPNNISNAYIKIETSGEGLGDDGDESYISRFHIDEFVIAPEGYSVELEGEEGYGNLDNKPFTLKLTPTLGTYDLMFDEDSITKPVKLNGVYQDDDFERDITLVKIGEEWRFSSASLTGTNAIIEDPAKLYKYHVEETGIPGFDLSDFLVSYENNDVAASSADKPITIKNKYIWYKLPDTGGIGVDFIYAIGLFLMITGLIGGTALIRRERRSD